MDGLECSEIKYKTILEENRLDSEYVLKSDLKMESIIKRLDYKKIGDFSFVTDGIHASIEFDNSSNINLISAKAPKKNIFDLSGTGFISYSQNQQNSRTQLKEDDIIISTVGTIGNCAVVNKEILPANADRHVGIIRVSENSYLPRYISSFILCKYGRYQTKRFTTGNVQPNLFIYKVKDIKVPFISRYYQEFVERHVLYAEDLLRQSKNIFDEAMTLFNNTINIGDIINSKSSIKKLSKSFMVSGRLDAEYYQSKYEDVELKILNSNHCKLKDVAIVQSGEFIEEKEYGDIGIDYIRGSEITNEIIDNERAIKVNISNSNLKTIGYNDLAFSMIGSVGNVSINKSNKGGVVSNNLGVIIPNNKKLSNFLLLYLLSDVGQLLFEKYQTRTAQPKIKREDVENFLLPILSKDIEEKISCLVEKAFVLRKQSRQLIDNTIKAVEMAIEKNEEFAMVWLEKQGVQVR